MESTDYIDFQKYWLVLKRRWLPAVGVMGIVVFLTALVVSRGERSYMASGKLLFKEDRSPALAGIDNAIDDLKGLTLTSEPLSTEAEVIRSIPVFQKTLEALDLKDSEGKPISIDQLAVGLGVEPIKGTDVLLISYQHRDPKVAAAVVNKLMDVYIQNDIHTNRAKAAAVREFITKQLPSVEANVRQSDVAVRRFKEQNRVVDLGQEQLRTAEVISELDNHIATTQSELASLNAKTDKFRNELRLDSKQALAAWSLSESSSIREALTQWDEVTRQLTVERTRYQKGHPKIMNLERQEAALNTLLQERIRQVLGESLQVPTGTGLSAEQFLQELPQDSLGNLQLGEQKITLLARYVDLEADRLGLSKKLTALRDARSNYKERANVMPGIEQNLKELERRAEAAQSTYQLLLTKLQETRLAENQNVGNARIISKAMVPEYPVSSKKKVILLAGGLVGILLGIATAFLLDLIDNSVKTVKEAKELFGVTLLGVIPAFGKSGKTGLPFGESERTYSKIIVRDLPHSLISQAYQMLQANLKFLSSDKPLQAIVVTSSVPGEGKSDVCANLATAMAQVGRRVLLVDGNMRYPSQHHFWDLTNSAGLSNILVGEVEFKAVVESVIPGLDVLTAGVIPPNPVALLDSKRMASLMEAFSKDYDYVIVDTPSLAGFADAPILGKMADGILLVVRPRVVNSASANAAKEFLARSGQNVLGLVANGVMIKNEPDSYFHYTNKNEYLQQLSSNQQNTPFVPSSKISQ